MSLESKFRSSDLPGRCFKFFAGIKTEQKFCDVTFVVGEQRISAHRIIVAAAIPFFQDTLTTEKDEITLPPDVDPGVFECLIDFAYTCELKISMENVRDFLIGAFQLGMDEVRDACCDFLAERLCPDNALVFKDLADDLHYPQLIKVIDHYVKERFVYISKTDKFLSCPFTYVKELIAKNDLQVNDEAEVLEAVMKWVRALPDQRKANLPELLRLVRMPLVTPLYLSDVVEAEELIRTSVPCRDLIDEAKNYTLFPQRKKGSCSFSIKPRQFMKPETTSGQNDSERIYKLIVENRYTVQQMDFGSKQWFEEVSLTLSLTEDCPTAELNHKMYFCSSGEIVQYDSGKNTMRFGTFLTVPRTHPGVASSQNKIYVCGGRVGEQNASNVVECFDPETSRLTKVSPMRTARWGLQAVTLGEYIYTLGGRDSSNVYASVERYPSVTGEWTTMPSMLTKRCPSAVVLNGKIYACGGYTDPTSEKSCATAEVYDPIQNKWDFISPMSTARCKFKLVARSGKLYAVGGQSANGELLKTFEVYDPKIDKWTSSPTTTCYSQSGFGYNDTGQLVLFQRPSGWVPRYPA